MSTQVGDGWGWMAPRNRPKRLEKKLRRRGYSRVIGKRSPKGKWALKPVCFCNGIFMHHFPMQRECSVAFVGLDVD